MTQAQTPIQATPQPALGFRGLREHKGSTRIMVSGLPMELRADVAMYDMFAGQHGMTEAECAKLIKKVGRESETGKFLRNCLFQLQLKG